MKASTKNSKSQAYRKESPGGRYAWPKGFFLVSAALLVVWILAFANRNLQLALCGGSCLFISFRLPQATSWPQDFPCSANRGSNGYPGDTNFKHVHIIHQTWKTNETLPMLTRFASTWKKLHPNWEYRLWTDFDNRELVRTKYPHYLPLYDGLPHEILRVDLVRFMYLHAFGGVYADLDTEPLVPLDDHLTTPLTLGFLSLGPIHRHSVPNAVMASAQPGHLFWITALAEAARRSANTALVESFAGPIMLTDFVRSWAIACGEKGKKFPSSGAEDLLLGDLRVLQGGKLYPFDWSSRAEARHYCSAGTKHFNPRECKKLYNKSLTITYWTHTWKQPNYSLE